MGRKPTPRPSFFKVMIGDFTNKIRIPPAFMKNFNGMLPHESILRSDTGRFWRVQMEVVDQDLFFQNGWPEFVKDHALEVGDFLIFWFLGNSTFDVRIYGRTGCEKKVALPKRNGKVPISFIKKERQGKGMGKFFKRSPSFQCKCHEGNQKKQVDVTGKSKTTGQ
ncbi:hypothetical protein HHK36_008456 [Tetracentron sinense]|uniref:TF-B3 domain-containing protein n=1 Tax=Tetracentron sinense TaxID=13715 RepID=A0A835DND5_TETSI|nr:hypothetical protein HHK36_008456 [Tetracentron sinense]